MLFYRSFLLQFVRPSSVAKQQGLMVIEFITIITVLSLIAIIAIPAYQNHKTRTRIAEGIEEARPVLNKVLESYHKRGQVWPTNNYQAGLLEKEYYQTEHLEHIEIRGNTFESTHSVEVILTYALSELGDDNTIILTVSESSNDTEWHCTRADKGTVPFFMRPDHCR
ncbi:MAG: pilin [Candidatus Competibacteraceae bacterium]|jgi:type IV pilus assembly protein PilA|nr:pilin [Candidatus Competibacteraceae bacterium]